MKQLFTFLLLMVLTPWSQAQIITTVAGNGHNGYVGDGGLATDASLYHPCGVATDTFGNIYISDTKHHCIRKVNSAGIIETIAGTGVMGYGGDGGHATNAQFNLPTRIALDDAGNIFIVDNGNYRIRTINESGIISTIAGNGIAGNTGDGEMATDAQINASTGLVIDKQNNIYFSDVTQHTIRKIDADGIVTTIAGVGIAGYSGDGGPASAAKLNEPSGIDIDRHGNLYIAEYRNNCIRKIDTSGIISTLTYPITIGYSGDGGPASNAKLNRPVDVMCDWQGNLYVADANNSVIRKISSTGIISTIVGDGNSGFDGDGALAIAAQLRAPVDLFISNIGDLYISDYGNNRIRKVSEVVSVIEQEHINFQKELNIYPNPNSGIFYINSSFDGIEPYNVIITDLRGKEVYQSMGVRGQSIDINLKVPSGMYVVQLQGERNSMTQRIMVQH